MEKQPYETPEIREEVTPGGLATNGSVLENGDLD
jgi:hypothetical protein